MTRVLFVGQKPDTVDFSDPALPPGFNAEKIEAGIKVGVAKLKEKGWEADTCMITPDEAGGLQLEKQLAGATYDCVVIGGGLRVPPKSLVLFERGGERRSQGRPERRHRLQHQPRPTPPTRPRGGWRTKRLSTCLRINPPPDCVTAGAR